MRDLLKLTKTEIEDFHYELDQDLFWQSNPERVRKAILETVSLQRRMMAHFDVLWNQIELLDDHLDPAARDAPDPPR
jgi:hypothetical protein